MCFEEPGASKVETSILIGSPNELCLSVGVRYCDSSGVA